MRLSTKSRYGTRAVLDIALQKEKVVPLKDIARRQQISLSYLEHLVTPLIVNGILRSIRGRDGGVALVKTPEEIKLSSIVQVLEGPTVTVDCVQNPSICERSNNCVTRELWVEVNEAMDNVLGSTTIADMMKKHKKKSASSSKSKK